MSFDGWLDARDSETVLRAWETLGARRIEVAGPSRQIHPYGAALLAGSFLGCSPDRFAWWATESYAQPSTWPAPTYREGRAATRSFLDHELDVREDLHETWTIRDVIEGARGVQHISIDCVWGEMTREGGNGRSAKVVRVFDRSTQRAVSIPLYQTAVWVVGEVDVSPLDLFPRRLFFKLPWKQHDLDMVRGLFAQLTADLDAHFDTSTTWPGGVTHEDVDDNREHDYRIRRRTYRYASGAFAIEIDERLDLESGNTTGTMWPKVTGLTWGHEVSGRVELTSEPQGGVEGWIDLRLPGAQLDATHARLAAIPGIQLS
jgi:hypothetical protein